MRIARRTVLLLGLAAVSGAAVGLMLAPSISPDRPGRSDAGGADRRGPLTFADAEGATLSLADFSGRTVLLNIWATWCPPCREEMPSLDRLQAKRGGKDFEVVALSVDRGGIAQVRPFYEETNIAHLAIYTDAASAAMTALRLVGLPTTILLAPDGRELARWTGPREWDAPEAMAEIERLMTSPGAES